MIDNKEKNFISAVVYVHNNQDTIKYFLKQLSSILSDNFQKYEIICVNDASTDESGDVIKNISKQLAGGIISIVNLSFFQGIEMAMNAGIDMAIGDFALEFDNPFIDYDIKTIMEVYHHSLTGYDIVATSNSGKKFTSNLFYRLYNKNANSQYKIGTETFRILSRRAINRIHVMSKTVPYRKALYANCGLKIDTITYKPTVKISKAAYVEHQKKSRLDTGFNTLILFTNLAYKISIFMTIIMMLITLFCGIYTITIFAFGKPVAGYTTTMLLLSVSFLGVFAILAIIIKYLSILVDLVFKKQKYVVESIEKL